MEASPRGRRRSESEDDRTLFAKGLCYNTTEETLVETFGALSARIPQNRQGRSKGFAYIEFETEEAAEGAMKEFEGVEIDGWVLVLDYVGRKRKNYEETSDSGYRGRGGDGGGRRGGGRREGGGRRDGGRDGGPPELSNKTLYVKGIAADATEDSLMDFLGCSSARIPRYRDSDENKGFAYADFEDNASAQSAIDSLSGEDGLLLEFARERGGGSRGAGGGGDGPREPRTDNLSEKTLYVKGISYDATEDSLVDLLGCSSVRIPRDRDTDEIKGFAYADFEDHASAQSAIDNLSGEEGLFLEFARERRGGGRGRGGGYRGRGRYRGGDRGGDRGDGGYNGY